LESRRSKELAALVTNYGGTPITAPALREIPLDSNPQALAFADALLRGDFDLVILLTGVGTRALLEVVETKHSRAEFVGALKKTKVVPRGPKPLGVLRELGVTPWLTVPEPNTWRELVAAIDATGESLTEKRVAVQEYGVANPDLVRELESRGSHVTKVPVYRWALPEDLEPLTAAIASLAAGKIDVALFTTGMQAVHLMQVAGTLGKREAVVAALGKMLIASIGPTTTEALREAGITATFEASHPKMGFLVREAAEQSAKIQ
jgi:uroporphyrinogen-III synthase